MQKITLDLLQNGQQAKEVKPENYTTKLQEITILKTRQHYESGKTGKRRNYTYVYYKTNDNTFYPARNGGYLDGLVGCMKLTKFKTHFQLID